MIVNNFRGIELYGSVHTSISSGSNEDNNKTFIGLEEFIGQAKYFSNLYLETIQLNLPLIKGEPTSKL